MGAGIASIPVMRLGMATALHTSPEALALAEEFATATLGKTVVRSQDRAGFVVNALLVPYLLAAIRMAESGFATAADVDAGMELGCAHPMGPLKLADLLAALLLRGAAAPLVLVEAPTYDRAVQIFERHGARVSGVPLRHDGINLDVLEERLRTEVPAFLYVIPDFQHPSGVTASGDKHRELVRLSAAHGFTILEDIPYRELRFSGAAPTPLCELAEAVVQLCVPDGGYYLSVHLPVPGDEAAFLDAARANGLTPACGSAFYPADSAPPSGTVFLRLPFQALRPEEFTEGVKRLAAAAGQAK